MIFVANTCAIITQIDIHLFIHRRRRRRQIFIREWPHLFTFSNFSTTKQKKKGLTMERGKRYFFPLLFNILRAFNFWLSHILSSSTCTFTFTFTYNINYLFNLLTN